MADQSADAAYRCHNCGWQFVVIAWDKYCPKCALDGVWTRLNPPRPPSQFLKRPMHRKHNLYLLLWDLLKNGTAPAAEIKERL